MERDYGKEIDKINVQLDKIKNLLTTFTHNSPPKEPQEKWVNKKIGDEQLSKVMKQLDGDYIKYSAPDSSKEPQEVWINREIDSDKRLSEIMEELCIKTVDDGSTGFITYLGVHATGGHQSNWISKQVDTDKLLELIESNVAAQVLTCIGNNDRLNMLLALLREPRTVAQLVEECGYNTTGQVYHHLKPLLAADLVKEDEHGTRGRYIIQPHRVQGIIMLLAGISDMLDTKYTQGNWDLATETE